MRSVLLFRTGARCCAMDLAQVVEIMRPLPVQEISQAPAFVLGLAEIRGAPAPVVSLAVLLGEDAGLPARFVTVRVTPERRAALAVDEVAGVAALDPAAVHALPPLTCGARGAVEAVGSLDEQLLFVLSSSRMVPEDIWQRLVSAKV